MAEFSEYREVGSRGKKRFNLIRKPNLKDASDDYRKLSGQLSPFPNYSGYCMYSAAKCEHSIVGSLKEQFNQSMQFYDSGNSTITSKTNQILEHFVNDAIWIEFQTWLDTARIFKEIDTFEKDINGTISAYAHAIQTCSSSQILTLVLSELAMIYIKHHRFYEAAEVYMEAGLFYEAINSLLRGNFYQDAYHCYQEMFKKQPNFENYTTLTDMIYTCENLVPKKCSKQSNITSQKISLLSIFKRKSDHEEEKKNAPELAEKSLKNQFSSFKCSSPFEFSEKKPTIDDYINFFLLRLYLYDPVKYEYPAPIIPIPKICMLDNFGDQDACQTFYHESLMATEFSLPYFDMNNSRWKDRSITDIIELNNLLETLYLSYRKELCPSIDNEYSDFDIYHQQLYSETYSENISQSKSENLKMKKKNQSLSKLSYSEDSEETEGADDSSSSGHLTSTRYDSKDSSDDDQQLATQDDLNKHFSITTSLSEPTSPALRLLETGELDDISALLQRLAQNVQNNDLDLTNNIKIQNEFSKSQNLKKEFQVNEKMDQIGAKWIKNSNSSMETNRFKIENNNDQLLRANIANRLYYLLNGNQVQLLCNILEEKD